MSFVLNDFMATKALYEPRKPTIDSIDHQHCAIKQLSLVLRHGARNPSKGDITILKKLEKTLNANAQFIGNDQFQWLANWKAEFDLADAMLLTSTGAQEHFNIAQRIRVKYASLFVDDYTPRRYPIKSTRVSRTVRSAASFSFGLFTNTSSASLGGGEFAPTFIDMIDKDDDFLLRFFKLCPNYARYRNQCCQGKEAFVARVVGDVAQRVAQRLGVDSAAWSVGVDDVLAMYTACQFDNARGLTNKQGGGGGSGAPSICDVFDGDALAALEFAEDTERERGGARGNPAHNCAGELVGAMRDAMLGCVNDKGECTSPASFWFAHAETIIPLSSALGLFESGELLTWNNTHVPQSGQLTDWPLSQISPFAANIGFALYECDNSTAANSSRWMVQAMHNEAPVLMFNKKDAVSLDEFLSDDYYGRLFAINTTKLCNANETDVGGSTSNYFNTSPLPSASTPLNTPHGPVDTRGAMILLVVGLIGLLICVIGGVWAVTAREKSLIASNSSKARRARRSQKKRNQENEPLIFEEK